QERAWPRLAGFAALAAPALMWTEFLILGLLRPGYNMLTRAASELGEVGAPHAALYNAGFFFGGGILTVVMGLGLLAFGAPGRPSPWTWLWRAGAVQVMVSGFFLF